MVTEDEQQRFAVLFRGRETCFGQYMLQPKKKIWTVEKAVAPKQWKQHLLGTGPFLGIVPILQDNSCLWGAIDIDDDDVDHAMLATSIQARGLPLIVCRSKSGGAHLYVFLKETVAATFLMTKLKRWAEALGYVKNADGRPIETFPKQGRLKPEETGNWINLPYFAAEATNRFAVNAAGDHLTLAEFLTVAEMRAVTAAQLDDVTGSSDPFDQGPPCLSALHPHGYAEGTRANGLFNLAIYFKLAEPDDWEARVWDYNHAKFNPPLDDEAVRSTISSVATHEYVYKCHDMPIQAVCKKSACRKQPFGILGFQRAKIAAQIPVLEGLTKILTDPVRWRVTLNSKPLVISTQELLDLALFRRVALEKVSYIVPNLKSQEWDDLVRTLLAHHVVEEAPEDAGVIGQFQVFVGRFLMKRRQAESKDDLLRGLPVQNGTVVWFRSGDLVRFLANQGFRQYELPDVYNALRKLGADHTKLSVKGQQVQVWTLPIPADTEEQSEEFDVETPAVQF